jgi:hypothetical protein
LHWGNGVAVSVTSNIYNNNILFDSLDDTIPNGTVVESNTGSGNLLATDPLFVNFPAGGSNSWFITWDFNLQISPTTSPAIGAGTDGTNIGITGGPAPYDPTVGLPLIESIDTAGSVKKGTDLSVSIEAQAN